MGERVLVAAEAAFGRADYTGALTMLSPLLDAPDGSAVFVLLARTLRKLGCPAEAAEAFERAAQWADGDAEGWLVEAAALYFEAGDDDRAQLIGLRLRDSRPGDARLAYVLARSFVRSGDMALLDLVLGALAASDDIDHLTLAGELLKATDRDPLALCVFGKLARHHADDPYTQFKYLSVARDFCDFAAIERIETRLAEGSAGEPLSLKGETAYSNLLRCGDERLNRLATNNPGLSALPSAFAVRQRRLQLHDRGDRIRIGYLSCDFFSEHATMRLLQSVLAAHDRTRFDVTLFCYTPDADIGADTGGRETWGRVVRIRDRTDAQAAALIRAERIDILVDLKGPTAGSRSNILNQMAAPVQVAWLGFPGSGVNIDCDYVIGDRIVLPDSARPWYHETFCRLPESYQPNDPVRRALPPPADRDALGLPSDRFVFAAFNAPRKMSRETIDCWAAILRRAQDAVLWMMVDGPLARANCLTAFEKRGVPAERIVFARPTAYCDHIARLQAADAALDTFPYNGHTTTSDQLWAGLPVITVRGSNFASRVSESLLRTIGLSELVAQDREAYVDLAVSLTRDPARVDRFKTYLAENRHRTPLFNAQRFCRYLEIAYGTMMDRAWAKLPPEPIDVAALTE